MAIDALKLVQPVGPTATAVKATTDTTSASGFGEKLASLIEGVEDKSAEANQAVSNMLDKSGDVHEAMIALQRAEMTLHLTVQVRNKLVQAYQDIMRMPV